MPYEPPAELAALSLAQIAEAVAARRLPPLAEWSPGQQGDSLMRIAADGRWYHEGSEITRPAMIRAFSALLVREGAEHFLLTPVQKLSIAVEDAPFIAVDVARKGADLAFRLNTDELVVADPEHPLRAAGSEDAPALYLAVRDGLEARLDRSTWLQLAEIALAEGDGWHVASGGARFALSP